MKKFLPPFFLFVFAAFFSNAQNTLTPATATRSDELILHMPYVDKAKTLPTLISMVESSKYIVPVAFCDDLKCLLLRVDKSFPEKSARILQDLKEAGFTFEVKSNATIQQVLNQSRDILNAENNWH
jgi:hypothetical protein